MARAQGCNTACRGISSLDHKQRRAGRFRPGCPIPGPPIGSAIEGQKCDSTPRCGKQGGREGLCEVATAPSVRDAAAAQCGHALEKARGSIVERVVIRQTHDVDTEL